MGHNDTLERTHFGFLSFLLFWFVERVCVCVCVWILDVILDIDFVYCVMFIYFLLFFFPYFSVDMFDNFACCRGG